MGGIVKSIGKAIKKLGKGIGRFLKKYKTTIILAAAVWAGLGAFGASASGASIWSPSSVSAGISRIFTPAMTTPGQGWLGKTNTFDTALEGFKKAGGWNATAKTLATETAKSPNVLSAIGKWIGGMESWQKYALTQGGMTILGSMLDTSAEDEMAAKYGGMGRKYGAGESPSVFDEHPEWAVGPPPSWPSAPTTTSQTSTPQQASSARAPATVGPPRAQQITAMRTTPLDVRPPGILGGRKQGLLQSTPQRRYA